MKMVSNIFSGASGIVLLIAAILVLVVMVTYAVYTYFHKDDKNNGRTLFNKYAILKNQDDVVINMKQNPIQPPYRSQIKVKLIPSKHTESKRATSIKYSEEQEKSYVNKIDHEKPSVEKPFTNYREKFFGLLEKSNSKAENTNKRNSKPEIIEDTSFFLREKLRSRRADSMFEEGIGRLTFTLSYSNTDKFLIVHLIAGRQIYSNDSSYNIRLPAVSIQIEGLPETEVTSNPDEAPNPEYDQEFTFSLQERELYGTTLMFIVWDIISNHETRVIGFLRVNLTNYHQKLLGNAIDCGPICQDIKPSLFEIAEGLGEVLISLYYDCVTDKILANLRSLRKLDVHKDDREVYVKISLLLDNDVIQCKRTAEYPSSNNIQINQTFEFSALSSDLNKITNNNSPKLLQSKSNFLTQSVSHSASASSIQSIVNPSGFGFDTLRNSMGILISVRAKSLTKRKHVIGRLYIGKTDSSINDEFFHWSEMVKHFDNSISQWHSLKLEKI